MCTIIVHWISLCVRKLAITLEPLGIFLSNFAYILIFTWSNPGYCQMSFIMAKALPRSEFCKSETVPISCTMWNILIIFSIHIGIDKFYHICLPTWHLSLVETLPRCEYWKKWNRPILVEASQMSEFWTSETGPISCTMWNIFITFCLHIDIDEFYSIRLSNVIYHRSRLCRGPNAEQVKMVP